MHVFDVEQFKEKSADARLVEPDVQIAVREWNGEYVLAPVPAGLGLNSKHLAAIQAVFEEARGAYIVPAALKAVVFKLAPADVYRLAIYTRLINRTRILTIASINSELVTHYTITRDCQYPPEVKIGSERTSVYVCDLCSSIRVRPAAVKVPKSYISVHISHDGQTVYCGGCHSSSMRLVNLMYCFLEGPRFSTGTRTETIGLCGVCLQATVIAPMFVLGIAPLCANCYTNQTLQKQHQHHPWNTGAFSYMYAPSRNDISEHIKMRCWCYVRHAISNCNTSSTVSHRLLVDTLEGRVRIVTTCNDHRFSAFRAGGCMTDAQFKDIHKFETGYVLASIAYNS